MNSLNDIMNEKSKANILISQKKYSQAEICYKKLLDDIEILLKDENINDRNEIVNQKKFNVEFIFFII